MEIRRKFLRKIETYIDILIDGYWRGSKTLTFSLVLSVQRLVCLRFTVSTNMELSTVNNLLLKTDIDFILFFKFNFVHISQFPNYFLGTSIFLFLNPFRHIKRPQKLSSTV